MPALAGEGHDHGDATPVATGKALPRFAAVSETFELVGVLDGKQVTLYLDRFADNTPVRGAKIDLEIAGAKFSAQSHGDDAYEIVLKEAPKPGVRRSPRRHGGLRRRPAGRGTRPARGPARR
jgi:hypothetical protein